MFYFVVSVLSLLMPVLLSMAYFTLLERKVISSIQSSSGPAVVGYYGMMQPLADGLKLFLKEGLIPGSSNKLLFYIAPMLMLSISFILWMFVPLAYDMGVVDTTVGMLFILAVSSIGVYGMMFSGWSSNSRYAFLGSLSAAAQMISYEVSMGVMVMSVIVGKGSLHLSGIVEGQSFSWGLLGNMCGFVLFFVSVLAETNSPPFDLPEAEAELVAGYNVEYSSMGFALFFLSECSNVMLMSMMISILFLGGWSEVSGVLFVKGIFMIFLFVWVSAVVPSYSYDQLMSLGWKVFLPLSLGLLMMMGSLVLAVMVWVCRCVGYVLPTVGEANGWD